MNFVKNFGPGPTSIVVSWKEIQRTKNKQAPKKTQTRTNLNGGDLERAMQKKYKMTKQDQPQWWRSGMRDADDVEGVYCKYKSSRTNLNGGKLGRMDMND